MKVLINNHDMIKKTNVPTGVEIGSIPKGVGLERMRWNGSRLIDLFNLNEIYVEYINGQFRLHCIQVPYSQLVVMQYIDRKKLWNDNGVYEIKSDEQITTERNIELRQGNYPKMSDQMGAIMKYLATKNDLPIELQTLIDKIDDVKVIYPKAIEK